MRVFLAIAMVFAAVTHSFAADNQPSDSSGVESLGHELLDDLSNEMQSAPRNPATRATRFDDLGEDIGQPSGKISLVRVQQGMQQAKSLLSGTKPVADAATLGQAGAVQQQVVAQLDQLIAELSKQCQGGQCQPSDQPPKPSQRSQKKLGKSGSAAGRGQTAARDSSDRLDRASAQPADKGDIEAMVKDLWGHLPERSREQMMQSFSEEFLPKYELEIEQYYRRLSEENNKKRPQ